jgi:hypothetical protein
MLGAAFVVAAVDVAVGVVAAVDGAVVVAVATDRNSCALLNKACDNGTVGAHVCT